MSRTSLRPFDRVIDLCQTSGQLDELSPGQPVVHRLVLGHEGDLAVDLGVLTGIDPQDPHLPLGWPLQAGHDAEESGLAGAIGTEETGHTGAEADAELAHGDLETEPLGQVGYDDGVGHASLRYRKRTNHAARATSPTITTTETHTSNPATSGAYSMVSPKK